MKYASSIEFNEKNVKAVQRGSAELDTTIGMLLKANFGPSETLVEITSESELVETFGYPTEYNYLDWFNAAGFLKHSSSLHVVRPLSSITSAKNACLIFGDGAQPGDSTATKLYNEQTANLSLEDSTITPIDSGKLNIYNKWAGNLNDISIMMCTSETEWTESISGRDVFDETIALESTIYTRSTLPTIVEVVEGVTISHFKNKDKVVVATPTITGDAVVEMGYYIYYANYTTTTTAEWVATTNQITDDDRVFVTSKNLAYTFDHTFTSATAFNNYLTDTTEEIYASEVALPDESDYNYNDRVLVRTNDTPDVFTVWYNNEGTWTTTGTTLANADKIFEIKTHSYSDLTIGTGGGAGTDTLTFTPDAVSEIDNADSMTQDTDITISDEILIKKDANGIITNSVVKYMDVGMYNKSDYSPLTYRDILPTKPDFAHNEIGLVVLRTTRDGWYHVEETFVNSLTSTSLKTNSKSNYISTNVNNYSNLIYMKASSGLNTYDYIPDLYNSVYYTNIELTSTDDVDYSNITDYTTLYNVATGVFGKNGYFQPEILIGYDCGDSTLNSGYLDAMSLIAEDTGMSLAVVGATRSTPGQTETEANDEIIENLGNDRDNTSFGGLTEFNTYTFPIGTMKKFYDQYNDKYRWLSVNGDVAGMMAYNDAINGPQSAVAGYNRGEFTNYARMLFDARINQNSLSRNGINAIIKEVDDGNYYLFEYLTNTTMDEITKEANVRRMVIKFKHLLKNILKGNFFEFNNRETRDITLYQISGIFEKYKANGGLHDYKLICDETNNTAERINANEFYLDIRLQPNRLIKHITINIINYDMGLNIKEL